MLSHPLDCRGCPLDKTGRGFSRPEGHGILGVLVVAEALGGNEALDGLPLREYAPAGSVWEQALRRCPGPAGPLRRDHFVLWNIVACQPPRNWLDGAPWEAGAIRHCKVHFDEVFRNTQPRCILTLGAVSTRTLTGLAGRSLGIEMVRGYVLKSIPEYDCWVVPTYHPSYLRRGSKKRSEDTGAKTGGGAGKGGMHLLHVLRHDILLAVNVARNGFQRQKVRYDTRPGLEDVRSYLRRVRENPRLPVSFDIETNESGFLDEMDLEEASGLIQMIQFSSEAGSGIALPFRGEYVDLAREILATPNVKVGHNAWKFDNPRLAAAGIEVKGSCHDTMEMWRRMQPDLPAGLQFVASFYGYPEPWKHLVDTEFEYYGCADVDATLRIFGKLPDDMKARGCWRSYEQHVYGYEPALSDMSGRGIRVNDKERVELGEMVERKVAEVEKKIQDLVPDAVRNVHPKTGYVKPPKENGKLVEEGQETSILITRKGGKVNWPAHWALRKFSLTNRKTGEEFEEVRWCKLLDFNPGSSDQLKAYIRQKGHQVPKDRRGKETTAKLELEKLYKRTRDPVYGETLELRKYDKIRSTYVAAWTPDEDGGVHPTFYHEGATGQLSSRRPNAQNIPKHSDLAKKFRRIIVPRPGNVLIEADYKSAHALTLGFEAQDPLYMRMARIDMHSFLAAGGLLKLKSLDELIGMDDQELKQFFKWHREQDTKLYNGHTFEHIRNKQAKPGILGYGFGMGYFTLFNNNPGSFNAPRDAKKIIEALDMIFPITAKFRGDIRMKAHQQGYLISLPGAIRWFADVFRWDSGRGCYVPGDDSEAAIAFLPAQDAHAHLKDANLRLQGVEIRQGESGHPMDLQRVRVGEDLLEKYRLVNNIHDANVFDCPRSLAEECMWVVKQEMEKPSEILKNDAVPEGLWIETDVTMSETNWAEMEDVSTAAGAGLCRAGHTTAGILPPGAGAE